MFASYSEMVINFTDWAADTLFTHQFGTMEDRQVLSSKLLGVHIKVIKEVFNTCSTNVPCVYLFTLGTVRDLRKSMKINVKYLDDMIVCKYGMTDNLLRRSTEHFKTFDINNINLHLKYFAYIDQQYISKAETEISDYFDDIECKINYDKYKELIILDNNKLNKSVKQQYINLSNKYAGHIKELLRKISDIENKLILQEEKHKNKILEMELKNVNNLHQK